MWMRGEKIAEWNATAAGTNITEGSIKMGGKLNATKSKKGREGERKENEEKKNMDGRERRAGKRTHEHFPLNVGGNGNSIPD